MVIETLEHLVHLDGRFSQSVVSLLFKPGRLTEAFLVGKRAAQVPPLRFYLFVSLLFFLTLPLRTNIHLPAFEIDPNPADVAAAETVLADIPEVEQYGGTDFIKGLRDGQSLKALANAEEVTAEEKRFLEILDNLRVRFSHPQDFVDFLLRHAANVIFFSLPVFALLTRILFRSARRTYLEHLVVALHLGSFYFAFSLVEEGWSRLLGLVATPLAAIVSALAGLYTFAFLPWMFHRVFKRGIWGTLWRTAFFLMAGTFYFVFALLATTVVYAMAGG